MKSCLVKLLIVLSCANMGLLAEGTSRSEVESKAERAVDALLRMKHGPSDIKVWAEETRINLGISENQFLEGFISRIGQVESVVDPQIKSSLEYNELHALHAAQFAMDLYAGNKRLEDVVLKAYRRSDSTNSKIRGGWISAIADYGSEQAVSELRKMLVDRREIEEFDRWASSRPRFEQPPKIPESNTRLAPSRSTGSPLKSVVVSSPWIFLSGLAGIGLVAYGIVRKARPVWIGGVALVILAAIFYLFKKGGMQSQIGSLPPPNLQVDRSDASYANTTSPVALKPSVLTPPAQVNSSTSPRELAAFDRLQEEITKLMAPFSITDPQDRPTNLKEREAAAIKLLDLLKTGMPEGCRKENWPMIVQQIIGVQSCSPAAMDRAMESVRAWIGNSSRTEQETMAALLAMMRWQQTTAFKRGTPEFQRFERIAGMQVEMFEKATPEVRARLLWNLEQAAKIVSEPKSQMPEKLIGDEQLLELVESLRGGAPTDPAIAGQSLMILSNRLRDQPDAFPILENTVKDLLAGNQVDAMGRTGALEMLTSLAKKTGNLPTWAGDEEIARQLARMRAEAVPRASDGQPTGKEPGFIDRQALAVIRNRVSADPVASKVAYGNLLTEIAGSSMNDTVSRLAALDLVVTSGALSKEEARLRFSEDEVIGTEVRKRFSK